MIRIQLKPVKHLGHQILTQNTSPINQLSRIGAGKSRLEKHWPPHCPSIVEGSSLGQEFKVGCVELLKATNTPLWHNTVQPAKPS